MCRQPYQLIVPFIDNEHPMEEYANWATTRGPITFVSIAKLLAVGTILNNRFKRLTDWAYAGLFMISYFAFGAFP